MTKEQQIEQAWQKKQEAQRQLLKGCKASRRANLLSQVDYWSAVIERLQASHN